MSLVLPGTDSPSVTVDHDAREAIARDLERSLLVEAGAGTGKTTVLVRRVVELVAQGRVGEVSRLVAITFTEAAAAELRDRIRRGLESAAADESRSAGARARCEAAVRRIDEAAITTIHGFAHQILTEHVLDAGMPPAFEVNEGVGASLAFAERWRTFVDELFADPTVADDLRMAFTLGIRLRQLNQLARSFHERWDRLVGVGWSPPPDIPGLDLDDLLADLDLLTRLVASRATDRDDRLVRIVIDDDLALRDALRTATGEIDRVRTLANARLRKPGNVGTAEVWADDKSAATDAVNRVLDQRNSQLARLRSVVLERLLPRLAGFTLAGADQRRRSGLVEFHDLLVFARDLLRHDRVVRVQLNRRFDVLCIDEFQDTDPIQLEIAMLLALVDPGAAPPATLQEAELVPGKLLVVGDPKQSIYRFRGADVELWDRAQEAFAGRILRLTQNFRSVPDVIEWVNYVFGRLLTAGDPGGQVGYVPLAAARGRLSDQPAVVVIGEPVDAVAAEIRRREADEVARLVRVIKEERWRVHPPESGPIGGDDGARPVRFADIALLVPTRTPLGEIERALADNGVPYRVESRSLVWATDEVRTLLSILAAVDDPADDVAVVTALRSPAFACSDPELTDYRQAGGRWDYSLPQPDEMPGDHAVVRALAALQALHERRWWEPVNHLVERIVRDRRLVELTMAERRPRDHWRRLRFVVDQARAFVEAGGRSLGDFLVWAAQQVDEGAQVVEAVVPEPDDDAVRILTVHGAKGLEFPVVVLAGLNAGADPSRPQVLWSDARPHVAFGPKSGARFETDGYAGLDESAREAERAESLRLLYVAATRARDHLVVSLHHRPSTNGVASHAQRLWQVLSQSEGLYRTHGIPPQPALPLDDPRGHVRGQPTLEQRAAWIEDRERLLTGSGWPRVLAATAVAALDSGESDASERAVEPRLGPGRRAGTAVGRAVHAVLQAIDLVDPEPRLDAVADGVAAGEGLSDDTATVAALARSLLAAPVVEEARAATRRWRELYVAAPLGERLLEGYIDLVFEDAAGGLTVVDYKTDRARTDAEVDGALARYRLQGAAYAVALGSVLGRPVSRCVFVFARPQGPAVERAIDDLPSAMAEVRALIAGGR